VTTLIQRMREELVRRNYAATTIQSYLKAVEHFREYINVPLDQLGPDDIRSYHAYLLENRKLAVNTVVLNVCALRFLYIKVLKRRDMKEDLPYPKQRQRLPVILSPGEVAQLIGAASNLYHRTILMTLYSTGLRRAELCRLKVSDIDSKRMMLRVVQGKGGIDREIPLSKKLLAALREYYRWMRPATYLFPGTLNGSRADKPITPKVVWQAVREACTRAGIKKPVSPHSIRHCFATHLLESGADLRSIQMMLGHSDLEATTVYLHLSRRHLQATANPLDQIITANPAQVPRSRRLRKPQ
jgi:integrase/recombinase XerD